MVAHEFDRIGEWATVISLEATLQVRGVLGRLSYLVLRIQLARTAPRFLRDLRHHVERHRPSSAGRLRA